MWKRGRSQANGRKVKRQYRHIALTVHPDKLMKPCQKKNVLVADVRTPTAFVRGPRHTDVLPRLHIGRGEQHERERERREDRQETGHD